MADRDITSSAGKGTPLTGSEHDQNLNGLHGTVDEQTGATYTVLYTDQGKTIQLNHATMVCTMDAVATISAAIDTDSWLVRLKNVNAAAAELKAAETIDGVDYSVTGLSLSQYDSITLQLNAAGTAWSIIAPDLDVVDINGGTIDGTPVGGTAPAAGAFTTLSSTGTATLNDVATDTIAETTPAAGVTIDSLNIKDAAMGAGTATAGDTYYGGASGATTKLPSSGKGGFKFKMNAGATAPEWVADGALTTTTTTAAKTSPVTTILATTTRIEIMLDLISCTSDLNVQFGDGSYSESIAIVASGGALNVVGMITLVKQDDDKWTSTWQTDAASGTATTGAEQSADLGGALDRIQLESSINLTSGRDWHIREYG